MLLFLFILITQDEHFTPEHILMFADHLYEQYDYETALGEYRRYIFMCDSLREEVRDRMIDCLVHLERYEEALVESESIADKNKKNYVKGWIFFSQGENDSSRWYMGSVNLPYKTKAKQMIGLSYAYDHDFTKAAQYISLPGEPPGEKREYLGALYALFPGGGHFYCGRFGDGLYSFLVVTSASLLAYYYYTNEEDLKFGVSLGAAVFFYAGNIYGGVNAVRNYNYFHNQQYLERIIEQQY